MGSIGASKKGELPVTISKTIAAAGTAEALSASHIFCDWVTIQPSFGNTGAKAALGFANTVKVSTNVGVVITKGNSITYEGVYLDKIFADVDTNGDKITAQYKQARVI